MGGAVSSRVIYEQKLSHLFGNKIQQDPNSTINTNYDSEDFWTSFWTCNPVPSLEELSSIIKHSDVTKVRKENPHALATLIRRVTFSIIIKILIFLVC